MTTDDQTRGYVAEEEYTSDYHHVYTPAFLDYVALLNSVQPPVREPGRFRFCDLGCGFGMTALTLAAANPQAEVHGIDFMPEHVELSNRMAAQAGLANAHFHALSFAQGLEKDLPMFDYIVAHGVYSWVTGDVRAEVVEFIRRFLAPGGIAYISYNTMPGHAQTAPVQKLVSHFGKKGEGDSSERVLKAFDFVQQLHAVNTRALRDKPVVDMLLHSVSREHPRYLAHEYLHSAWEPRYFIDVAAEMAKADLTYVGTATLFAADERFTVGPDHKALLDALPTRVEREFIKDYLLDANFRRDVYSRGARVLTPQERDAELGKRAFALRVNASAVNYICQVGLAEVGIESPAAHAIVNALAAGAKTVAEIMPAPAMAHVPFAIVYDMLLILAISEQITPVERTRGTATRFNAVVRANNYCSNALASPLGVGIELSLPEMMLATGATGGNLEEQVAWLLGEYARINKPVQDAERQTLVGEAATTWLRTITSAYLQRKHNALQTMGIVAP